MKHFDLLIEASQEDFKIELRDRLTKMEIFILDNVPDVSLFIHEIPQRYSISIENALVLHAYSCLLSVGKILYPTVAESVLSSKLKQMLLTISEHMHHDIIVSSAIEAVLSVKSAKGLSSEIILSPEQVSFLQQMFARADSAMQLVESSVNTRIAKNMGFEADVVLESLSGIWSALKSISIDSFSTTNSHLHETAISYITKSQQNKTLLSSDVAFIIRALRTLGDMDDSYLLDLDGFELDNLEYIIT